jgi:hypothetical protein
MRQMPIYKDTVEIFKGFGGVRSTTGAAAFTVTDGSAKQRPIITPKPSPTRRFLPNSGHGGKH